MNNFVRFHRYVWQYLKLTVRHTVPRGQTCQHYLLMINHFAYANYGLVESSAKHMQPEAAAFSKHSS